MKKSTDKTKLWEEKKAKWRDPEDMLPFLAKSAVKGITDIADLPANLAHLAERGGKKALEFASEHNLYDPALVNAAEMPIYKDPGAEHDYFREENVDRPSKWVKAGAKKLGIEDLTPNPDSPLQHILGQGMEFATSSLVPGSAFVKGGTGILGRLKKGLIASRSAAPVGATSAALEESGVKSPLVANMLAIPTGTIGGKIGGLAAKTIRHPIEASYAVGRKAFGLTPKDINLPALKAAKSLGVDLPATVFTKSPLAAHTEQALQKMPIVGTKIKEKYTTADKKMMQTLKDIYNKVGPENTPGIESLKNKLYDQSMEALPAGAQINPVNTIKSINSKKFLSPIPTIEEKEVKKVYDTLKQDLDPTLVSKNFGTVKIPIQPVAIDKLMAIKQSLNRHAYKKDEGLKKLLRPVAHSAVEDIGEYGKLEPGWHEIFKKAEKLHGDIAKREELEALLGKSTNYGTEELSHNMLSKIINTPKSRNELKKLLTLKDFGKVNALQRISKAIALKNKHTPNPSGTAATGIVLSILGGLANHPIKTIKSSLLPTAFGGLGGAKLLTSKKFLESALRHAENPNLNLFATESLKNSLKQSLKDKSLGVLGRELTEENKKERRNATFKNAK